MMDAYASTTPRRGFLGRLAATSLALGVGGTLSMPEGARALDTWGGESADDTWPQGVKGKHRQVFDAVTVNDGFAFGFAMTFLNANNEASKLEDDDLSAVIVLRHHAIPLAFTDQIWAKYKLGEVVGVTDPATKAPAERNVFYHPREGDIPFPEMAIERLLARGAIVGVCNVALTILSGMRADAIGVPKDVAKQEWIAGLIPGMTLVPSGTWAVNRAQERGCSYCYAG